MTDPTVTFRLDQQGTPVPEADVRAAFVKAPDRFDEFSLQQGDLTITQDGSDLTFGGTLLHLVPQFCLQALSSALSTGAHDFKLFASDYEIRFSQDGKTLTMQGNYLEPHSFPLLPFANAMADAAERYVALCKDLWPDECEDQCAVMELRLTRLRDAIAAIGS